MVDDSEDVRWSHYVLPYTDEHPAEPLAGVGDGVGKRVLLCPQCHSPQVQDSDGWHCPNPTCHTS